MSVVIASIEVDAPIESVWEYVSTPARFGDWVTIVDSIDRVDRGALRPGFRMDQTLHLRGVHFKVRWTLKSHDAPRFARWEGAGPVGSKAVTEYFLQARRGGTRLDYHNEFRTPFGPLGAAASKVIVGGIPEKEANASLRRLKKILESAQAAPR